MNLAPLKMYHAPPNLKTWLRACCFCSLFIIISPQTECARGEEEKEKHDKGGFL